MVHRKLRKSVRLGMLAVLLVGVLGLGAPKWLAETPIAKAQAASPVVGRTITVVGEGKVKIQPDIARANFGVEVVRPSVREALDQNKETMDAVLAALQEQGIAEEDIQTTGFSIYAERFGPQGPLPEDQVNYRVSNNVTVVIRDLASVGTVVDAAVEAGANNIYGIDFRVDEPGQLESEARQNAVTDAEAKAAELAELNGVSVGEVVSISEVISSGSYYSGNFAQPIGLGGGGGATPISPGQLELVMQLMITYAIAE
ncbi:MAG TPA: SIMPL domain-containing protein [Caldilineaceae bacterium]|nr:SIMPL domain-containing protein [Caldilineaceae bacterium]